MSRPKIKGLTLYAVWAWCIAHLDKRVENRNWRGTLPSLRHKHLNRWIAIHAGANVGSSPGKPAARRECEAAAHMAQEAGWQAKVHTWSPPGSTRQYPALYCSRMGHGYHLITPGGLLTVSGNLTHRIGIAAPVSLWDTVGQTSSALHTPPTPIRTSQIVAIARISDLIRSPLSDGWYVGGDALGIVLKDVIRLRTPIDYSGSLGLFSLPISVRRNLQREYRVSTGKTEPFS